MKVAITSQGDNLQSLVDTRFSRCSYFAIYNSDNKNIMFLKNPNKESDEGAGPASVNFIAKQGVSKIVSGEFGMKIKSLLNDLKIEMIIMKQEKTIEEIIELLSSKN